MVLNVGCIHIVIVVVVVIISSFYMIGIVGVGRYLVNIMFIGIICFISNAAAQVVVEVFWMLLLLWLLFTVVDIVIVHGTQYQVVVATQLSSYSSR